MGVNDPAIVSALDQLETEDPAAAKRAGAALDWLTAGHGLALLTQARIQVFLWHELPTKWLSDIEHHQQVASALARAFDLLDVPRYAAICRSSTTRQIFEAYEHNTRAGQEAFQRADLASGVRPAHLPEFEWGNLMGVIENRARNSTGAYLEIAVAAGELVPGRRGWREAQRDLTRAHLTAPRPEFRSASFLDLIANERLQRWLQGRDSKRRRELLEPLVDELRRPSPFLRAVGPKPAPLDESEMVDGAREREGGNGGQTRAASFDGRSDGRGEASVDPRATHPSNHVPTAAQPAQPAQPAEPGGPAGPPADTSGSAADIDFDPAEAVAPVRWLLDNLVDGQPLTDAGNLSRAFVHDAASLFSWWDPSLPALPRTEEQLFGLWQVRHLVKQLGFARRTGRRLVLTARGREVLGDITEMWRAVARALVPAEPFRQVGGEVVLALLVRNEVVSHEDLVATVTEVLTEEGWRDHQSNQPPDHRAVRFAMHETISLLHTLNLIPGGHRRGDDSYRLTVAGRASAIEALRHLATGPSGGPYG